MYHRQNRPGHSGGQGQPQFGSNRGDDGGQDGNMYSKGNPSGNYHPYTYPMYFSKYGMKGNQDMHIIKEICELMYDAKQKLEQDGGNNQEFLKDLLEAYERLETYLEEVEKDGRLPK